MTETSLFSPDRLRRYRRGLLAGCALAVLALPARPASADPVVVGSDAANEVQSFSPPGGGSIETSPDWPGAGVKVDPRLMPWRHKSATQQDGFAQSATAQAQPPAPSSGTQTLQLPPGYAPTAPSGSAPPIAAAPNQPAYVMAPQLAPKAGIEQAVLPPPASSMAQTQPSSPEPSTPARIELAAPSLTGEPPATPVASPPVAPLSPVAASSAPLVSPHLQKEPAPIVEPIIEPRPIVEFAGTPKPVMGYLRPPASALAAAAAAAATPPTPSPPEKPPAAPVAMAAETPSVVVGSSGGTPSKPVSATAAALAQPVAPSATPLSDLPALPSETAAAPNPPPPVPVAPVAAAQEPVAATQEPAPAPDASPTQPVAKADVPPPPASSVATPLDMLGTVAIRPTTEGAAASAGTTGASPSAPPYTGPSGPPALQPALPPAQAAAIASQAAAPTSDVLSPEGPAPDAPPAGHMLSGESFAELPTVSTPVARDLQPPESGVEPVAGRQAKILGTIAIAAQPSDAPSSPAPLPSPAPSSDAPASDSASAPQAEKTADQAAPSDDDSAAPPPSEAKSEAKSADAQIKPVAPASASETATQAEPKAPDAGPSSADSADATPASMPTQDKSAVSADPSDNAPGDAHKAETPPSDSASTSPVAAPREAVASMDIQPPPSDEEPAPAKPAPAVQSSATPPVTPGASAPDASAPAPTTQAPNSSAESAAPPAPAKKVVKSKSASKSKSAGKNAPPAPTPPAQAMAPGLFSVATPQTVSPPAATDVPAQPAIHMSAPPAVPVAPVSEKKLSAAKAQPGAAAPASSGAPVAAAAKAVAPSPPPPAPLPASTDIDGHVQLNLTVPPAPPVMPSGLNPIALPPTAQNLTQVSPTAITATSPLLGPSSVMTRQLTNPIGADAQTATSPSTTIPLPLPPGIAPAAPRAVPGQNPATAQAAKQPPSAAQAQSPQAGQSVRLPFTAGSEIITADSQSALDAFVKNMTAASAAEMRFTLTAYATAADGQDPRRLSLARALAVRGYLIAHGVKGSRMDVKALGNTPVDGAAADRVDIAVEP